MSQHNHINENEMTIQDWNQFIEAITEISLPTNTKMWYRGHADSSWKLHPLVQRDPYNKPGTEQYLTTDFYIEVMRRKSDIPKNLASRLALMQHYGLPTRLLDWSESPLIALYFATSNWKKFPKTDAAIWVLNPSRLNELHGFKRYLYPMDYNTISDLIHGAFYEEEKSNSFIACCGVENDLRLYVQQANFTIHSAKYPMETDSHANEFLKKLIIPSKLKPILCMQLELLGFRERTVFPDMDHISHDLKQLYTD